MAQLTFGQLLKQARVARGFSQAEVAANRLTKAFVSLLEHDGARPSLSTLRHLSARLDRPLAYFLGGFDARTAARILDAVDEKAQDALRTRRYAAAHAAFLELRDLAGAGAMPSVGRRAALGIGEALLGLRRLAEAAPFLHEALEDARETKDRFMECRALTGLGLVAHRQGRLGEAVEQYQTALALIPQLPKPAPVLHGELLLYLSTMLFRLGKAEESLAAATESLRLLEVHAPERTADVMMNLGTAHRKLGDYAKALEESEQALRVAEQYEDLQALFRIRNNLAIVLVESGRPHAALQHCEASVTVARRLSDVPGECRALAELARVRLVLDRVDEARAAAEEAVSKSHSWGLMDAVACAAMVLGIISVAERRPARAFRYLTDSYRHFCQAGMTTDAVVAGRVLALITSRWAKTADAVRLHNEVFAMLRRLTAQELSGLMQVTKMFDQIIDRVLEPAEVPAG